MNMNATRKFFGEKVAVNAYRQERDRSSDLIQKIKRNIQRPLSLLEYSYKCHCFPLPSQTYIIQTLGCMLDENFPHPMQSTQRHTHTDTHKLCYVQIMLELYKPMLMCRHKHIQTHSQHTSSAFVSENAYGTHTLIEWTREYIPFEFPRKHTLASPKSKHRTFFFEK